MRSLAEKFNELRTMLRKGLGSIGPTGFDPIYYLIFQPDEMLAVKQRMPEWEAQLKIDGFDVHKLSMISRVNTMSPTMPPRTSPKYVRYAVTGLALADMSPSGS